MKNKPSRWLLNAALCLSALTAHAAPEHQHPTAAPGSDMQQMWKKSLARAPLSATAAFGTDGRLWLASVKEGHLYLSASSDLGKHYSQPVAVNPQAEAISADGENRPKIAFGPKGEIYVSYTQSLEQPFTGNIRFSRSLDGGKTFSAPLTVNDNLEPIGHRFDALGVNGRGQIYLAWLDKRDQASASRNKEKYTGISVYYAVSEDGGASFGANRRLAEHSCECCRVALTIDTDGTPVAVWRHIYGKNTRDHAIARLDGSAPQRLSKDEWEVDACPHHGPSLSIADDGSYHVAWFTNGKARQGLFYARSTDQGTHFSTPLAFGKEDAQAGHPHVLSMGKQVYLVWKEFDGKNSVIQLMTSRDGGNNWSKPATVAQSADASDHPLLIANQGRAYLSWHTAREGFRLMEVTDGAQP